MKIERALISVSDKTGVEELARFLQERGVEILSTGGTARLLKEKGVEVKSVDSHTAHPEIMGGRVKTLHPKIHGGILAIRDNTDHRNDMFDNKIEPIDLVVVNLYPFVETIKSEGCTLEDAIENIDIGGPAMVRSSAKNHKFVAIVVDPGDYPKIMEEIGANGEISQKTRNNLAKKAFGHTSDYDSQIYNYLSQKYPD